MTKITWGNVAVGGIAAGLVSTLLSIVLLGLGGHEFTAALLGGGRAPAGSLQAFLFAANIVAALWGTWLYAALRAHYGPGVKTGAIAGVAWWLIVSMQSAKWLALSSVPLDTALVPGLLTIPAILLSAIAGGWCYENFRWKRVAVSDSSNPISRITDA